MPKPNLECYICKKPIYRIPSKHNGHNVCSYSCRNKYFSGSKSYVFKGGKRDKCRDRINDKTRKLQYKIKAVNLLGGKCYVCGYNRCIASLDFHHKDPKLKDHSIKNINAGSWEKIEKEIAKCVLLCSNCHREHHWRIKNEPNSYRSPF